MNKESTRYEELMMGLAGMFILAALVLSGTAAAVVGIMAALMSVWLVAEICAGAILAAIVLTVIAFNWWPMDLSAEQRR